MPSVLGTKQYRLFRIETTSRVVPTELGSDVDFGSDLKSIHEGLYYWKAWVYNL